MKPLATIVAVSLCACAPHASSTAAASEQPTTVGHVVVTPLVSGVYAAIRAEPLGLAVNANSLFIVNDDHVAGDQAYRDAFPGVRFIAQTNTRTDLIERGRPNRAGQLQIGICHT